MLFKKKEPAKVVENRRDVIEREIEKLENKRFDLEYASKQLNGEVKRVLKELDFDKSPMTLKFVKRSLANILNNKNRIKRACQHIKGLITTARLELTMVNSNLTSESLENIFKDISKTLNIFENDRENMKLDSVLDKFEEMIFGDEVVNDDVENEINALIKVQTNGAVNEDVKKETVQTSNKKEDVDLDELQKMINDADKN